MLRRILLIIPLCFMAVPTAIAGQIVLTTGYANSQEPESTAEVNAGRYFADGGGYAFGTRIDIASPHFWFGPSFFFWNNLTGDPDPNRDSHYFQIELGGRLFYRTHTVPALYSGVGLGYSVARGEIRTRFHEIGGDENFDGEFPTASMHLGMKTPTETNGIGLVAEFSYHFGLDEPAGRKAIGPAQVWAIQIGVAFDTRFAGE